MYDKEKGIKRLKMIDIDVATEKGREHGLKEGLEQEKDITTRENAKNLLINGVPIDIILKIS